MHIPDGFLSPETYLSGYAIAAGAWHWAVKGVRDSLDETTVPRLATLTALAYGLGLVMIPVPGGTSGHGLGIAILALVFGVPSAFLAYSLVLLLQSLLLGAGGITALAIDALAMGLVGSATAVGVRRLLRSLGEDIAIGVAGWMSVVTPGVVIAVVLGIQPHLAHQPDGSPLFFPFGLSVTLPAVLIPHAIIGVGEGLLTVLVLRYVKARHWL